MNKKYFGAALFLLFALILTACTTSSASPTQTSKSTGKLSAQNQIIVGTILLEDTEYAISADQAAQILPMWMVLKDLNESGSAAQEEIDGLVNQIQQTMTKDQTNAIKDMGLTSEDMTALIQSSSGEAPPAQTGSTSNAAGGGPGGSPPDMPGGMPGGAPSGTTSTTGSASAAQMNSTPSALFDLVIQLLQKKIDQ